MKHYQREHFKNKPLMSIELERALVYLPDLSYYPPLGEPFGPATPFSIQSILRKLVEKGWEPLYDPSTKVLIRVRKKIYPNEGVDPFWTCTSDAIAGIFETTISASSNLHELEKQQLMLDKEIRPILREEGLFLWNIETMPWTKMTRELYFLFHTYWRGEYIYLRELGEDHYWFSLTIADCPCIDMNVEEAITFLRIIHRLTGVSFFLFRSGSIVGGTKNPSGFLTIRPQAWYNLWSKSPDKKDIKRVGMPSKEILSWKEYFSYLMGFRFLLFDKDKCPHRVEGNPSFFQFWFDPPASGWKTTSIDGQVTNVKHPKLVHLLGLQRQLYFSRLRWEFKEKSKFKSFATAYNEGEEELQKWLMENFSKLYIEIRNDSCPPCGEELSSLSLYLGLLSNIDESKDFIINKLPYDFWKKVFTCSQTSPMDVKIDGQWIPDILNNIVELAKTGLKKRGLHEEKYLEPIIRRIENKITPAEEMLKIFEQAGVEIEGIKALAQKQGLLDGYL